MIALLILGAAVVLVGPLVLYVAVFRPASYEQQERQIKMAAQLQKMEVDRLRAQRLKTDLQVVDARAHLVTSQETRTALQIEKLRRDLGMPADYSFTAPPPDGTGNDSGAFPK